MPQLTNSFSQELDYSGGHDSSQAYKCISTKSQRVNLVFYHSEIEFITKTDDSDHVKNYSFSLPISLMFYKFFCQSQV